MPYTKTIVCLANSRKLTGRCVAGKEWDGKRPGAWCRPVSAKDHGELTAERWYRKSWRDPELLDLIEMGLLAPRPSGSRKKIILSTRAFDGDSSAARLRGSWYRHWIPQQGLCG